MTNKQITDFWTENGYYNEIILSEEEVKQYKDEANRLIEARGEDTRPYKHPHKDSELFEQLMKHPRVIEIVEMCMGADLNREVKLDALQTWMYFKPPGELGRDVHQNIFYSHANRHDIINISIALDDADRENGGLYVYPKSHNEWCLPINIDEDRLLTNPDDWRNERGKPCVLPEGHDFRKIEGNTRKGEMVLLHSHTIHGSETNNSNRFRRNFLAGYALKGTRFTSGNHMKRERIDIYELQKKYWNES